MRQLPGFVTFDPGGPIFASGVVRSATSTGSRGRWCSGCTPYFTDRNWDLSSNFFGGSGAQRSDIAGLDPEPRRRLADRGRGVARAQVAVVLLDHAGIDVPQGRSDDHERSAVHDGVRGECVASDVEVGGRADAGAPRGFRYLIVLMRFAPRPAVGVGEDQVAAALPRANCAKELLCLIGQVNVEDPL